MTICTGTQRGGSHNISQYQRGIALRDMLTMAQACVMPLYCVTAGDLSESILGSAMHGIVDGVGAVAQHALGDQPLPLAPAPCVFLGLPIVEHLDAVSL
jgi:hypothetical protein